MSATVRVKSSHPDHEQGFYVINESDFDAKIHELWADASAAMAEAKRAERMKANPMADYSVEQKEADARKAAFAKSARDVVNLRDR